VVQRYIFALLGVIAVTVFLILAYRLFSAEGKEEQHKKAWNALLYAAIGLAVVPLAYVLVRIATGFDLRF
jgi:multisubunit Na+/H+ antiporter MnhB subunit